MRKKKSFTIIEILITMIIMGTLSSALIPRIGDAREETKQTMSKVDESRKLASEVDFDGYTFSSNSAGGGANGGGESIVHDLGNGLIVTHYPEANVSYTLNAGFDTEENFTAGLITITDGTETYTIMDRNLGATKSGSTCSSSDLGACGYYFQWGNNYGFPSDPNASITTSSTQVDASGYGPGNYYSSDTFITNNPRDNSNNMNLRGWVSGTNEAMQGPCPEGYHVPYYSEWLGLLTMLGFDGIYNSNAARQVKDRLNTELYLPFAGFRYYLYAGVNLQGTNAYYWSSTAYSADNTYYLYFILAGLRPQDGLNRSYGLSVRCFKN